MSKKLPSFGGRKSYTDDYVFCNNCNATTSGQFHGRIFFELLVQKVAAKRKSVRRNKGTKYLEPQRMDRSKFNELIILVPKNILDKVPASNNILIIADCAGGHSVCEHW